MKSLSVSVSLLLIVVLPNLAEACGPGRTGNRRRMLRKYPPLVQRQYIPNVSENTLGASGRPEGAIRRQDKRFKELVQNWNPDIEFRDDERTGADRMMSQRLKEKLSTLAISVMNQWPNVKLRVIEGWDEDNKHSRNSLHYEGRAVDITTSDRDNSKYGMLARLAVEAGFDWVHYESRSHVHCSVKSEKADTIRSNGCFDAASLVETPDGQMEMSQLQTNDMVLAMNPRTGQLQFSPIIMWLDRDELGQELFVELRTKSDRLIRLTSSHLIYVADEPFDLTQINERTGNGDNNQNNYYYYETQTTAAAASNDGSENSNDNQTLTNVPSTNNANQLPNDYSSSFLPAALNIDEVAGAIYARNAIVGQYLLINLPQLPEEQQHQQSSPQSNEEDSTRPLSRLVFLNKDTDGLQDDVQRGRHTSKGGQAPPTVKLDQIVSINYVTRKGIYAPLTREGNIVVNSVVASCYAVIFDHELAHMSFAPVRWLSHLNEWLFGLKPSLPVGQRTVDAIGRQETASQAPQPISRREIHWYPSMLYQIAKFILPTRYLY